MITAVTGKALFQSTLGEDADTLIIGDQKSPENFAPIISLPKWGGQVNLSLDLTSLSALGVSFTPTFVGVDAKSSKIAIGSGAIQFYFQDDGVKNLKFGVILNSKPLVNSFSFNISGGSDLDFCFQPLFSNVNPDGSSWEIDESGRSYSPVGVGNSYAVYHKTFHDHIIGQTNYKCGKVGDFYCPKFIDAMGHWTWGIIFIENNIYKLTIPQDFLNQASYPIICNDTFGYNTAGSVQWGAGPNTTEYLSMEAVSPTGTYTLTNMTFHLGVSDLPDPIQYGIYSEETSVPHDRLAYDTSTFACGYTNSAPNWKINPVPWSYALTSATQYWAAVAMANADAYIYLSYNINGSHNGRYENSVFPATAASNASSKTNEHWSVYGTCTAAGGLLIPVAMNQYRRMRDN